MKERARDLRARTISLRSIGLSFRYLFLVVSITFLVGCGNNLAGVGTVDSWEDPPEVIAIQEPVTVNQDPKDSPAVVTPAKPEIDSSVGSSDAEPMPEVVERVGGC